MSCDAVRDRLLRGESGEEVARHLAACPECARFAARWEGARAALGRRIEILPPSGFARRVTARRPGSTEELGRWALRALPAALVLALALAWVGLDQTPYPSTTLLAEEPSPDVLFTYSVFRTTSTTSPAPTREAPR
jgi:anti-sigma factor RsiW